MPRFRLNTDKFSYPEMDSKTHEDGKRVYYTRSGPAPSVTTILSSLPHPELDEWRNRVGDEEADRISKEASTIGTYMHDQLEAHVRGTPYEGPPDGVPELMKISKSMFNTVRLYGLAKLDEVWGIEVPLHYEDLYAGRTDLIGIYKRKPSIIDYKTSKFHKPDSFVENYKLQIAAYAVAHEWMFPDVKFEQGVLLIGIRPNPEFNKKSSMQTIIVDEEELDKYKLQWVETLDRFYSNIKTGL